MKTFNYFQKLFASPVMVLESVRAGLELDLLRIAGLTGGGSPQFGMAPQRATPDLEYGKPAEADPLWLSQMKMAAATKAAWRIEQVYSVYPNSGTALIQMTGVIDKHLSDWDLSCYGGCDLADIDQALIQAEGDQRVEKVAMYVNSPGGSVVGVPETAARVAALTQTKQVEVFCDGLCCSAAEYIVSQADKMTITPSARVGSVGVYLALLDATRWAEMEGYKVELITAGKWKAMGSPFKPLTTEERTYLQGMVDDLHADFKDAVKTGRANAGAKVADANMEAQVFTGAAAVEAGFADDLTNDTLDEFVARLL